MRDILWQPTTDQVEQTSMWKFKNFLNSKHGLDLKNYGDLHNFSIESNDSSDQFWQGLIDFYDVKIDGETGPVNEDYTFKKYAWFPKAKINFAENLLKFKESNKTALHFIHESDHSKKTTYQELYQETNSLNNALKGIITKGDVLACYMPNIPETCISMLATTACGGVFTSTSCDFGVEGVVDRFSQSRPKVLVASCGYEYNGKYFDQIEKINEVVNRVESIEKVILVDFLNKKPEINNIKKAVMWNEFLRPHSGELEFTPMNFDDPLYIMYSSGTTGKPKCIVHGIGGTLLQHVKELGLHCDLTQDKSILYFTTCGWMMWNWLVSSLYFGAEVCLYEGSPGYPSLKDFFKIVDDYQLDIFGTSPKFLKALEDTDYDNDFKLKNLKLLLSTGAPLLPEQFDFIYQKIHSNIQVSSICGGTDIIGCFMLGNPILPVKRGDIQCLGLGMDVACFDEQGNDVVDTEGELVCKKSFPSRPLYFLNDENNELLNEAYFNKYKNIWHHGDFITLTCGEGELAKVKSVQVFGRSDATLNPGGVRIGTSEIYRQTESMAEIEDSLCVGKQSSGDVDVYLYVLLKNNIELDVELSKKIKKLIREKTTPRHVPKEIIQVKGIPYTRSGKKMELLVTKLINGKEIKNLEAVANPDCLVFYQ